MNETLRLIHNRKSVRSYLDKEISRDFKDKIIHSAMRAPTAGNMMLYTIIEVEDQKLKDQLAVSCDNQPFIAKAPFVLLFLADYQRWNDFFTVSEVPDPRPPEEGDLMLACCDALIAAQNAVIAAESMGIGSCYIGDILENYEFHREMFDLPDYVLPITLLCFGYPGKNYQTNKPAPRYPQEFIHYKNRYKRLNSRDFNNMYKTVENRYFPRGEFAENAKNIGQHFYLKKHSSDFMREMNRSVRIALKNWRENGPED
ncbi:MAG: nitroreductase family protein [Spirochaetaceae bacterium]|nr:nitroreductase family protein [Spirochaetaceae bacterium]